MGSLRINAETADELFGNDAAEFEDEASFNSFSLERPELKKFVSQKQRICIANAYKGEGKSAILRQVRRIASEDTDHVLVSMTGIEISPNESSWDTDLWARKWKSVMFENIASEVGRKIGMAWSDNATSLVELAEKNGFKDRSLVGYIVERLSPKDKPRSTPDPGDIGKRMERYLAGGKVKVWLLVDDIDQNFENTKNYKTKIGSFFDAIRSMVVSIPELNVRFSIRPNVWKIIKQEYASTGSHFDQYMVEISWSSDQIKSLLARRIDGFIERNGLRSEVMKIPKGRSEEALISYVFQNPMNWNGGRPPHIVLDTLSRNRPRWLISLCKISWDNSRKRGSQIVALEDLEAISITPCAS